MPGRGSRACATAQSQVRPGHQVTAEASPGRSCAKPTGDIETFKLELLTTMRNKIADIFKCELQKALGDVLSTIGLHLQALQIKVATDGAAAKANIMQLKGTMEEMKHSLTSCLDDITTIKATIKSLTTDVAKLEQKCEDLEDRSRRNNIRIMGTPIVPSQFEGRTLLLLLLWLPC